MNAREAKRTACFHAALIVESALGGADLLGVVEEDDDGNPTRDGQRVVDAFDDLLRELYRRSGRHNVGMLFNPSRAMMRIMNEPPPTPASDEVVDLRTTPAYRAALERNPSPTPATPEATDAD